MIIKIHGLNIAEQFHVLYECKLIPFYIRLIERFADFGKRILKEYLLKNEISVYFKTKAIRKLLKKLNTVFQNRPHLIIEEEFVPEFNKGKPEVIVYQLG